MAFGVVLFTLLAQSTTMGPLLRKLGVVTRSETEAAYELQYARLLSYRYAVEHLDEMHTNGFLSQQAWESLKPELESQVEGLAASVRTLQAAHPELAEEEIRDARRELLRAQRGALVGLRRDGIISQEALEVLTAELDAGITTDEDSSEPSEDDPTVDERTPSA
jgi:CPA1 family monovalent cation:H+ antiporter